MVPRNRVGLVLGIVAALLLFMSFRDKGGEAVEQMTVEHTFVHAARWKAKENVREVHSQVRSWPKEQAYVADALDTLGKVTLEYLQIHPTKANKETCNKCSLVPYWIDPSCAHLCEKRQDSWKCHLCSHWAVKLSSSVGSHPPGRMSDKSFIFQLPILNHVIMTAAFLFRGDVDSLRNAFIASAPTNSFVNSQTKDAGKGIGDQVLKQIEKEIEALGLFALDQHLKVRKDSRTTAYPGKANTGGGGGMGLQIACDDTVRLSIGGGGGQGLEETNTYLEDGRMRKEVTYGGGRGAGFQVFSTAGEEVLSFGGGGGGGSALVIESDNLTLARSFGSKSDSVNESLALSSDVLLELRQDLQACAERGGLKVFGGGGVGGGVDLGHSLLVNGDVSFSFALIPSPCPVTCLAAHLDPPPHLSLTPAVDSTQARESTCPYPAIRNETEGCVTQCNGKSYHSCLCPCFRDSFASIGCSWALNITCV